jgi:hypothetical protein
MKLLDLSQQYRRKIDSASDQGSLNQMTVFKDVTYDFVKKSAEQLLADHAKLRDFRVAEDKLVNILRSVFDLDNIQRNDLIRSSHLYNKLLAEQTEVLQIQSRRQQFLSDLTD